VEVLVDEEGEEEESGFFDAEESGGASEHGLFIRDWVGKMVRRENLEGRERTKDATADPPFDFAQGKLFGDDNKKTTATATALPMQKQKARGSHGGCL
jgi:hypothetical protein